MPTDNSTSTTSENTNVEPEAASAPEMAEEVSAQSEEPIEPDDMTGEDDESREDEPDLDEDGIRLIEPDPRITELEKTVQELQARLRAVSAAYKQQQDDMAAARDRLARQAALKEEVRRGEVVATLFEPVQNLQRSIDAGQKGSSMDDMLTGLEMLQNQFMEAFKGLGLEEVPGKGTRFNPNLHEALSLVPVPDASLDEIVIEVFSAGFRIGSRLITPARVIVGEYTAPPSEVVDAEAAESDSDDELPPEEAVEEANESEDVSN